MSQNEPAGIDESLAATVKIADDRLTRYQESQLTMSPKKYLREVRFYWVFAFLFSIVSTIMMASSVAITLKKNAETPLNFVRVDGLRVEETFDVRRDVLMENSIRRAQISNQEGDR